MKTIAIILPGTLLPGVQSNLPEDAIFYQGALEEAAEKAKELEKEGIEVIISRGGTARSIQNAVSIPVIFAEATSFDVLETLWDIKLRYPAVKKIILNNFYDTFYNIEKMSEILELNIEQVNYLQPQDIEENILIAKNSGAQVIIGGTLTVAFAQKHKMIGVLQQIGDETIKQALSKARDIISIRRNDKEKNELLSTLLNFLREGVISVDKEGKVILFNNAAEKILNFQASEIIGKPLIDFFPNLKLKEIIKNRKYYLDDVLNLNETSVIANRTPIQVDNKIIGAVCTFQPVDSILRTEQRLRKELYSKGLVAHHNFNDIIGDSPQLKKLINRAKLYAQTSSTILVTGESGTGKELIAQSIHRYSNRQDEPFVAINCAALPESLLESELFGYEEGAFTGAKKGGKQGLFELAHKGTIFLDEIGDMPLALQARLLRVIQNKEVMRIGGEKIIPINVRIIAATNKNLLDEMEKGAFREDLYYRVNVLNLYIPALRERPEDIPLLLNYFLKKYCATYNKPLLQLPPQTLENLKNYSWPGNVRELENFSEGMVVSDGEILEEKGFMKNPQGTATTLSEEDNSFIKVKVRSLAQMTDDIINEVYHLTGKNKNQTAKTLEISRTTVWKRFKSSP